MDDNRKKLDLPTLNVGDRWNWDEALRGETRETLAQHIATALPRRRWFGSKARTIKSLEILDALPLADHVRALIVQVHYATGPDEVYQVPLAFAAEQDLPPEDKAPRWIQVQSNSGAVLGVLYDALGDAAFCSHLLDLFDRPGAQPATHGVLVVERSETFEAARGGQRSLPAKPVQAEQSNSSVLFGDRLILKIFRRVEMGLNPDFELSAFLTRQGFAATPPLAGSLVYEQHGEPWGLAMLQAFVANQGDAWGFTLDWLSGAMPTFEGPAAAGDIPALPAERLVPASENSIPSEAQRAFDAFLKRAALLGQRTAEMHLALAADDAHPDFAPEPFSQADRERFCGRASDHATETFALLKERLGGITGDTQELAERVAALEPVAHQRYQQLAQEPVEVAKIRIHGDYHLGQVLATSDDFAIIDFEGEPVRSIAERRQKQLALRDVGGMIRSLHYASCTAATAAQGTGSDPAAARRWAGSWYAWSCVAFLAAYRSTAGLASFLPSSPEALEHLLNACLLEKAIYELRYELNNRPDWVYLPLNALVDLLGSGD